MDCTLGHGGHAMALLSIAKDAKLIGFDVDDKMMEKVKFRVQSSELGLSDRIEFVRGNYADIVEVLA